MSLDSWRADLKPLHVDVIPARSDNYIFLLYSSDYEEAIVVDPCSADPVLEKLKERNVKLTAIWNTHHHHDHIGGNLALKEKTGCYVVGSKLDRSRIPGIDVELVGGAFFEFAGRQIQVLDTPGHTNGAISFWVKDDELLFCGDTLFSLGCGRLFEGTSLEMWNSLEKLKELPSSTKIYCAHEYTEANGIFALTIEPENEALKNRLDEVKKLRLRGHASIPSTLAKELDSNPFLRADSLSVRRHLGMEGAKDWEVFAAMRSLKDKF